jgi:hypothetical protein
MLNELGQLVRNLLADGVREPIHRVLVRACLSRHEARHLRRTYLMNRRSKVHYLGLSRPFQPPPLKLSETVLNN